MSTFLSFDGTLLMYPCSMGTQIENILLSDKNWKAGIIVLDFVQ